MGRRKNIDASPVAAHIPAITCGWCTTGHHANCLVRVVLPYQSLPTGCKCSTCYAPGDTSLTVYAGLAEDPRTPLHLPEIKERTS